MSRTWHALLGAGMLAAAIGCGKNSPSVAPKVANAGPAEHAHKPSAHGGQIVEIGRDNYHAEVVFEKGGTLRLYLLGHDESKVQEIEARPLPAYAKGDGQAESAPFVMRPEPQAGDRSGMASLFVGKLPGELVGKKLDVTIPNVSIGGERFRIAFTSMPQGVGDHGMPAKVADDAERELYLTAGGKYSLADIQANGNVTASEKFQGQKAAHDLKPKAGDKICPITLTKANPRFSWVIGGKTYEFCCPPCVDEFVALAKQKPDEILPPEEYRKK